MANIDLNISPYFDDFDDNKDFLRVLFRPGFPVQARELSQAQTILQQQITRMGNYLFKDGSRVTGAKIDFDNQSKKMTLTGSSNISFPSTGARIGAILANLSTLEGKVISNASGSVKAVVLSNPVGTVGTNSVGSIYLKYITSTTFSTAGGYIYATVADNPSLTAEIYNTYSAISDCSLAHIEEGVYYIQGFFTRVAKQTVVIDATNKNPSVKLGFTVSESLITPNSDATLFDNARGSTNEGAPGAHRLKQTLSFGIRSLTANNDPNFFQVMVIENGVAQQQSTRGGVNSGIGDVLATRTFEGHGDFSVDPISIKYSRSDSEDAFYVNSSKIKAYVRGFRIDQRVNTNLKVPKPLSFNRVNSQTIAVTGVPYINVNKEADVAMGGFTSATSNDPHLHTNRLLLQDSDNKTYGYARAYALEDRNQPKLHLYDIKFFQKLRLEGPPKTLSIGNDVKSTRDTKGYYVELENTGSADVDHVTDSEILVIDFNKPFRKGQVIRSSVNTSFNSTIAAATTYSWADITNIRSKTGNFKVEKKSLAKVQNATGKLFGETQSAVKTARDDAKVFDNDFEVLFANPPVIASTSGSTAITPNTADTLFSTANANGDFTRTRIDDGNEISKKLKYVYLKIRNDRTSSINYGWSAQDRESTLLYSDIYDVYGISKSDANNTFSHFKQINITISGGGIIPQGSIVTGTTSKCRGLVALSNSDKNQSELTGSAGYHTSRSGTGSTEVLEIIKENATSNFIANEILLVTTPNDLDSFVNQVTYVSDRTAIIVDTLEKFGTDIIDNYFLDDGQRNNILETGRIIRKPLIRAPEVGDLTIFFSYFEDQDTTNKFYYNADSYSSAGFFATDPRFFEKPVDLGNKDRTKGIKLRDVIDFRKKVTTNNNTGQNTFHFNHKSITNRPFLLPGIGETGATPAAKFTMTYDEYLSRYDIYYVATKPYFGLKRFSSLAARNPQIPKFDSSLGMPIATALIPAAFKDVSEIITVPQDNKRYTMKDIGGIEKRIRNLEDAISLSFLETQALTDDTANRTKLGFIVDDFKTDKDDVIQDNDLSTAKASIADESLRPLSVPTYVETEILDSSAGALTEAGIDPYYFDQGFLTKTYTQSTFLDQPQASSSVRVNPYAELTYKGYITLDPAREFNVDPAKKELTKFLIDRNGIVNDSEVSVNEFNLNVVPIPMSEPWSESWNDIGDATVTTSQSGNRRTVNTAQNQIRNIKQKQFVTRDTATSFNLEQIKIDRDAFCPSREIVFKAEGLRPNVSLIATFEYINVTDLCQMTDNSTGDVTYINTNKGTLTTDALGMIRGRFTIPPSTFKTGQLRFTLFDSTKTTIASAIYIVASKYEVGFLSKFRTDGVEDVTIRTEEQTVTTTSTEYLQYGGGGGGGDSWGDSPPSYNPSYMDMNYGDFGFGSHNDGSGDEGGGGGGGKIVCTMMNKMYNMPMYSNRVWMRYNKFKKLDDAYELGYHKLFLYFVKKMPTNTYIRTALEWFAKTRTHGLQEEMKGNYFTFNSLVLRLFRPIVWFTGKLVQKGYLKKANVRSIKRIQSNW